MISFKKIFLGIIPFLISLSFAQTTKTLTIQSKEKFLPFGLKERAALPMPEVAIALSGGGARGLAQIGVLKALYQAGIPVDIITGTSMGSIIGGLYAAGYSVDQIDSIASNTDWNSLLASDRETNRKELFVDQKVTEDKAIFSLRLQGLKPILPTALNSGQKISNYLNLITFQAPIHVDSSFNELMEKYRAVCTNLVTGQSVVLDHGSLSEAMRASSSVSFYLSPVKIDSLLLVDGGLVDNIPIDVAMELGADYVIGVNTTSELHTEGELSLPWVVADQIVSIPMKRLINSQLNKADLIVTPDLNDMPMTDFDNVKETIQKGYEATLPFIGKIKNHIDSLFEKKIDGRSFYIKNILMPHNVPESEAAFFRRYSTLDSVSSTQILMDMYSLYSSGNYKNIKAEIKEFGTYSTVNFITEENPVVKNILVRGINLLDSARVNSIYSSLLNHPYNPAKIVDATIRVINLYRNMGYSLADVDSIKFDEAAGRLIFNFDEGKISGIVVRGNDYTDTPVITRELPFSAGDYFNSNEIKQGLTNLRSTNLFDDIFLNVKREDGKNIILLQVRERPSSLMRLGFRIDNVNNAQLSIGLVDENFFGSGTELGMLLFGGNRNRAFVLEQKSNRIFNTYFTYKIDAYYKFDDVFTYAQTSSNSSFSSIQDGEYREIYYGGSFSLGTQVQRFGNLIFQGKYQIDQVKILQDPLAATKVDPYKSKIVSLSASSTIDTQDKYPYPQRGFYFKGVYESAQTILGGDIGYTNINFEYKSYFTFSNESTISPRFVMGFADKTLPTSEQFSLGGQNSFFGMHDNEFRGRQLFTSSLEYRYKFPFKIFFDTYFKLRYDLGWVWQEQEEIRFKDLRHGIGTTLSFDTPIGPADFSIGRSFRFVKNLPGNPISLGDVYFYFSIGYYY